MVDILSFDYIIKKTYLDKDFTRFLCSCLIAYESLPFFSLQNYSPVSDDMKESAHIQQTDVYNFVGRNGKFFISYAIVVMILLGT